MLEHSKIAPSLTHILLLTQHSFHFSDSDLACASRLRPAASEMDHDHLARARDCAPAEPRVPLQRRLLYHSELLELNTSAIQGDSRQHIHCQSTASRLRDCIVSASSLNLPRM